MPKFLQQTEGTFFVRRQAQLSVPQGAISEFDVILSSGAPFIRTAYDRDTGEFVKIEETLEISEEALDLQFVNGGAPVLRNHDVTSLDAIVGRTVEGSAYIKDGVAYCRIRLSQSDDLASFVSRIREGTIRDISVGYSVAGQRSLGRSDSGVHRVLVTNWTIKEVSFVTIPADASARVRDGSDAGDGFVFSSSEDKVMSGIVKNSADKKKDRKRSDQSAGDVVDATVVEDGGQAESVGDAPAATSGEVRSRSAASSVDVGVTKERSRAAEITALSTRHGVPADTTQRWIRDGVQIDAVRAAILDMQVSADVAGNTSEGAPAAARSDDTGFVTAVTNALMHRSQPDRVALNDDAAMFRGMSIMDLGRRMLERNGLSLDGMDKMQQASEMLVSRSGMHTTSDFPAILANVANKSLRSAYEENAGTFKRWARRISFSDFKDVTRTQLSAAPDLVQVPESGEFTHGTMSDGSRKFGLSTYGRIISVSRQTLINDDMDALSRIPVAFGARAAALENELVYSMLLEDYRMPDGHLLFSAEHNNLGTASGITETAVTKMYELFARQVGLKKERIRVMPAYLIVPSGTRAVQARKLLTQTTPASTDQVAAYANSNLQIVEEPLLLPIDTSAKHPWFAVASSSTIDTVEYGYLNGQDGVYTETKVGFEVDGIQIKARLDFGAAPIDHRGMYRNNGN